MQTGIKIRLFKAGFCTHPGFIVLPGSGIKPKKFPAGIALIEHPKAGYVLFDTGYHPDFHKSTRSFPERFYAMVTPCHLDHGENIAEQLQTLDIHHSAIKHLLLSHFHADHIAGLVDFPDATIHCHQAGLDYINTANRINRVRKGYLKNLVPEKANQQFSFFDSFTIDIANILDLKEQIGLYAQDWFHDQSLYVVNLPGHAAGHIGLLIRLENSFVFLLADACWLKDSLAKHIDQHWIANILSDDHHAYKDTLQKLRRCYELCDDSVKFVPSHCEETIANLMAKGWMS
ncbi:MBL fold metallo-hydrolase [Psychromonas algicola]|uniref:MBL fold metallo-hydrolase n=1 Tax=Psychromonas algicola TaxID=2555642 RepID=UPI0010689D40|nr:MBL fold metallo-hydrolase [Psychromonas sp. RZ5]TEW51498.1 MBL fold metallo-hydrolase [Psychromonas sp. RZ5]